MQKTSSKTKFYRYRPYLKKVYDTSNQKSRPRTAKYSIKEKKDIQNQQQETKVETVKPYTSLTSQQVSTKPKNSQQYIKKVLGEPEFQDTNVDQVIMQEAKHQKEDKRQLVKNVSLHPYNCVARIKSYFPNQTLPNMGIGNFIAPLILMTSRHVVYYQATKELANRVEVIIQQRQQTSGMIKEDTLQVDQIIIHPYNIKSSNQSENERYDIALLILKPIGQIQLRSFLKIKKDYNFYNQQKENGRQIKIVSYRTRAGNDELMQQDGSPVGQRFSILKYQLTTYSGDSGAGVFIKQNDQWKLIGIHKGSYPHDNGCVLLSSLMISTKDILGEMIEKHNIQRLLEQTNNYFPSNNSLQQKYEEYQKLRIQNQANIQIIKRNNQIYQEKKKQLQQAAIQYETATNKINQLQKQLINKEKVIQIKQYNLKEKIKELQAKVEKSDKQNKQVKQQHFKIEAQKKSLENQLETTKASKNIQYQEMKKQLVKVRQLQAKVQNLEKQNTQIKQKYQKQSKNQQQFNHNILEDQGHLQNAFDNEIQECNENESKSKSQQQGQLDPQFDQNQNAELSNVKIKLAAKNRSEKIKKKREKRTQDSTEKSKQSQDSHQQLNPKEQGCVDKAKAIVRAVFKAFKKQPIVPKQEPIKPLVPPPIYPPVQAPDLIEPQVILPVPVPELIPEPIAPKIIQPINKFQFIMSIIQSNGGQRLTMRQLENQMNKKLSQQGLRGYLKLNNCNLRLRINQLISYDWPNVSKLQLNNCLLQDQDWDILTRNIGKFPQLEILKIWGNEITTVTNNQLNEINHLNKIWLRNGNRTRNNLNRDSVLVLDRFFKRNLQITCCY